MTETVSVQTERLGHRIAIFIRHADYHQRPATPSAHQPFSLTDEGARQALGAVRQIQEMLEGQGWACHPVIHSATMLRAWQTAKIIADGLEAVMEVAETDLLAERGLGAAANLSLPEIERVIAEDPRCGALPDDWKSDSHFRLPVLGAESLMQAGERVAGYLSSVLDGISPGEGGTAVLFVGHGASFRHAAHHLGVLGFDEIAKLSMYHARPVALARDGTGGWHHVAGEWKVRKKTDAVLD